MTFDQNTYLPVEVKKNTKARDHIMVYSTN